MPKLPSLTAEEAEKLLLRSGFTLLRTKGRHSIYRRNNKRIILPFHSVKTLHPKIIKQIYRAVEKE